MQAQVVRLQPRDSVRVDAERIQKLYIDLGPVRAEDAICRAIEELAQRLFRCDGLWTARDERRLGTCLRAIIALSNEIGLLSVSAVASDVLIVLARQDEPAIAATLARLRQVGEASLCGVWEVGDISG